MDSESNRLTRFSNAELAAELDRLGLTWVAASNTDRSYTPHAPEALLAALASSNEARMRLAIIPLMMARPAHSLSVLTATRQVTEQARVTLICYYTAAVLLKEKFGRQFTRLELDHAPLPDYFSDELGLPRTGDPDDKLKLLAERQAILSGRALNWYGTYEHAAERFLRRAELELAWAAN